MQKIIMNNPDYEEWINIASWSAWQAVMLLSEINPHESTFYRFINEKNNLEAELKDKKLTNYGERLKRFYRNENVIKRAIEKGEITGGQFMNPYFQATATPYEFILIAKKYKLTFPRELENIQPDNDFEENLTEDFFKNCNINKLNLDASIIVILKERLEEINKCFQIEAPLATIFLCGSTLEGVLLGVANKRSKDFLSSPSAPKKAGAVIPLDEWKLSSLIDVSHSLRIVSKNTKKFNAALRDFRNYIHPYKQIAEGFSPDQRTARLCCIVLSGVIEELSM